MTTEKDKIEAIEILQQLGLTFSQARIYVALVASGESPVRTITKTSGVARAEVYRIMPTLQKVGLVEKVLGIPIKFKAISLQDGLNILLKQENVKHRKLQKNATKLASIFKENNEKVAQETENQFVVVPGKEAHMKWLKSMYEKSQSTEGIMTWNDNKTVYFFCEKEIHKAVNRGLKTRIIVYIPENEKTSYENEKAFDDTPPNVEIRTIFKPPLILGGIFDNKETVIATTLNNPIQKGENILWSTNPSIVALFHNYFETLWKNKTAQTRKILDKC